MHTGLYTLLKLIDNPRGKENKQETRTKRARLEYSRQSWKDWSSKTMVYDQGYGAQLYKPFALRKLEFIYRRHTGTLYEVHLRNLGHCRCRLAHSSQPTEYENPSTSPSVIPLW